MGVLLSYRGGELEVAPEALAIAQFKALWDRDMTSEKVMARMELAYVWMMRDSRSAFQYVVDDVARDGAVRAAVGLPAAWRADKAVTVAMETYSALTETTAAALLRDTRVAVDKLRRYLRDIDLNREDGSGKPIYPLSQVVSALSRVPQLIRDLDAAEKAVLSEDVARGKTRGSAEKSALDDTLDI